jgi:hypothetical protein
VNGEYWYKTLLADSFGEIRDGGRQNQNCICRVAQLEQELDLMIKDSRKGTSGTEVEIVILDGIRFSCTFLKSRFF